MATTPEPRLRRGKLFCPFRPRAPKWYTDDMHWGATAGIGLIFVLVGCGGGSERTFTPTDASAGSGGTGGTATGGTGGTATGGTGGTATGGTGGTATGGTGGTATGGTGGTATGGTGGTATGGTGGTGGNAGAGGTAPTCDGSNHCVTTPATWKGPITYAQYTGGAPACPTPYPGSALTAHQNLKPGSASCSCTCGAISLTCPTAVIGTGYSSTNCATGVGTITMPINSCIVASNYATTNSFNFKIGAAGSSCGSPTVNNTLPKPAWGGDVRICEGVKDVAPGACGSGICVPTTGSPYGSTCIYKAGDNACPSGFTGSREVVYGGYSDTRACSACTCNKQNATCSAIVTRYQSGNNTCSGSSAALSVTTAGSSCITKASQNTFRTTSITKNPKAYCAKSGGALSGSAKATQPTTICCQ